MKAVKNFKINGVRDCIQFDLFCIRMLERLLQKLKLKKDASQAEDLKCRLKFTKKDPGQFELPVMCAGTL